MNVRERPSCMKRKRPILDYCQGLGTAAKDMKGKGRKE